MMKYFLIALLIIISFVSFTFGNKLIIKKSSLTPNVFKSTISKVDESLVSHNCYEQYLLLNKTCNYKCFKNTYQHSHYDHCCDIYGFLDCIKVSKKSILKLFNLFFTTFVNFLIFLFQELLKDPYCNQEDKTKFKIDLDETLLDYENGYCSDYKKYTCINGFCSGSDSILNINFTATLFIVVVLAALY